MAKYDDVVEKIMSQVSGTNVEAIFGESRQIGDKVIIPVGKISYGWGAGGGTGKMKGPEPEGEGAGAGMGVNVKPIGFIIVTADRVSYEPIVDLGPVMIVFASFLGLLFLKFFKVMSRKMMMGKRCPMWGYHHKYGHHRGAPVSKR